MNIIQIRICHGKKIVHDKIRGGLGKDTFNTYREQILSNPIVTVSPTNADKCKVDNSVSMFTVEINCRHYIQNHDLDLRMATGSRFD